MTTCTIVSGEWAPSGYTIVNRIIYTLSSGTTHSCQYAMAAILKAANEGRVNIHLDGVREYAERAHAMKELFTKYGFEIVYDRDLEEPIADGFYFTIIYPGFAGDLTKEILYYGISAIPFRDTGSKKQGLRACVSQTELNRMPELERTLETLCGRSHEIIEHEELEIENEIFAKTFSIFNHLQVFNLRKLKSKQIPAQQP